VERERNLVFLVAGALVAVAASLAWFAVNYVSMLGIGSIKLEVHSHVDLHILLHLTLLAIMIMIEWWIGVRLLRYELTAEFAKVFQKRRWLRASCGPFPTVILFALGAATLFFAECVGSKGGHCKPDVIVYKFGRMQPWELAELQVLIVVALMALLIRTYAWLLHADEVTGEAYATP